MTLPDTQDTEGPFIRTGGERYRVLDEQLVTAMGADVRDENGKVVQSARAFSYTSVRVEEAHD